MTQTQTIEERVRDFVLKQFPLARKNGLKAAEQRLETGLIDSLGIRDLVHFLEEEFKVQVTDEELLPHNFQSLQAVAAFILSKHGNGGPPE